MNNQAEIKDTTAGKLIRAPHSPKLPRAVKENFVEIFHMLGGVEGMFQWASANDKNLTEFYKMYSKLLPRVADITSNGKDLKLNVITYNEIIQDSINNKNIQDAEVIEDIIIDPHVN